MRLDEQIKATGADVQPVDEKGMGLVLKRLESARKLGSGYQPGMASEWMAVDPRMRGACMSGSSMMVRARGRPPHARGL